jgi:HSP20 family protein
MVRNFLPKLRQSEQAPSRREEDVFGLWDDLLRSPWGVHGGSARSFPAVDVQDKDKEVVVTAELPGLELKDIDLSVVNDALVLKGEKKFERTEEKSGYTLQERGYGSFHRRVPLPDGVKSELVKAEYKNGVLTVRLPKDERKRPKRIAISG